MVSAVEHPSVLRSVEFLEQHGFTATRVDVDNKGLIDPEAVRAALTQETILICVHHVNHDVGAIEPIRSIGEIAGEKGIPFFVDATISAGWLPVDVQEMGATLLSLSAHRFYGPKGIGVLYRDRGVRLTSLIRVASRKAAGALERRMSRRRLEAGLPQKLPRASSRIARGWSKDSRFGFGSG